MTRTKLENTSLSAHIIPHLPISVMVNRGIFPAFRTIFCREGAARPVPSGRLANGKKGNDNEGKTKMETGLALSAVNGACMAASDSGGSCTGEHGRGPRGGCAVRAFDGGVYGNGAVLEKCG